MIAPDASIEERFVAAIDDLAIPEPDLVPPILAALTDGTDRRPASARRWSVALAAAVVGSLVVLAIAPARDAVADWLGLGDTAVERVLITDDSLAELPSSLGVLGDPVDVASVTNPLPELGEVAQVYERRVGAARSRSFTWAATDAHPALADTDVGLVLTVSGEGAGFQVKSVVPSDGVEFVELDLDGFPVQAMWIPATHRLLADADTGPARSERVLVWVRQTLTGPLQYRIEADVGFDEAVELAALVRVDTDLLGG